MELKQLLLNSIITMYKKIKIYNAFRDLNSYNKLILSCKMIKGVVVIGDEIIFNSMDRIKVIDVETNLYYNEVNLTVDENLFNKMVKLNEIINKEILVG